MQIGRTRCLLGFFLALLWSVAPFTLPAVNAQAQKIRISLSSRSNTNATYYVAQGKGFFTGEGLEVEFTQVHPGLVPALPMGEPSLRAQSLLSIVVQVVSVSPPHDLMLQQMGLKAISGPPEIGVPSSGLFAADRLIKEHPQILRRTIRAALKANRFIEDNREETVRIMTRAVPQAPEGAARSYDVELKALAKDGQMTDAEVEFQMDRLAEKKRPLDEIRDFSFARQALKELEAGK